jgi:hypothetical protein
LDGSKGQIANVLPLTVEQGTEEENWIIFTGLAALLGLSTMANDPTKG